MTLTREDFQAWREHPVTELVVAALSEIADMNEAAFKAQAWSGSSPEMLVEIKQRALAYRDLANNLNAPDAYTKFQPKEA